MAAGGQHLQVCAAWMKSAQPWCALPLYETNVPVQGDARRHVCAAALTQGDVELPYLMLQATIFSVIVCFMITFQWTAGDLS